MYIRWVLLISLLSLALGGCGSSSQTPIEQAPDMTSSNPQEIFTETPSSDLPENSVQLITITPESTEMPINPPPLEKYISLSKKDLANRLQIDPSKITTVEAAEITWPDAALGCPSPGKIYTQGLVPGYRIRFDVERKEYIYHTDLMGQIILCPEQNPRDSSNPSTSSSPTPHIGVPIN